MAKTVNLHMEELRRDLAEMKQRVGRLRAEGRDLSNIEFIERWIADAEAVLARWDKFN